ncbi:hypothetical protein DEJ47_21025 [Streptomyces venezuelae]|uniref:Uncharacterized protein n=1 Tax=Streptomyces venezuelae TaxID=54571 RepID=A0A5P2BDJ3_STRVZ|nr:hypothetical protein DEJ47_21025 [Streptomyces venezuelae]
MFTCGSGGGGLAQFPAPLSGDSWAAAVQRSAISGPSCAGPVGVLAQFSAPLGREPWASGFQDPAISR